MVFVVSLLVEESCFASCNFGAAIWVEDLGGWNSLVGLVDVLNGHDRKVAVIPKIAQGDLLAGRQAKLVDLGLGQVQGDGHGEKDAIGKAVLLDDPAARIVLDPLSLLNGATRTLRNRKKIPRSSGQSRSCSSSCR